jgi:cation diffusion facilitator family transporter
VSADREQQIVKASVVGIVGNSLLAAVKAFVGIASGSIAITLDAANSLVDAVSSVITLIGTKLARMAPNRDHPFGYGRIEYLASMIISALIISAGVSALTESIRSIMNPTTPDYSIVTLVVVGIAAAVKAMMGVYLKRVGKEVNSSSLVGSGMDSLMDSLVSLATLVAAILYLSLHIMIESWLAAGISLLICKSGIELLVDTLSKILGKRVSSEITDQVAREAHKVDGVLLENNVILTDNGPDRTIGSIHVTVDGNMTVAEFDSIARSVQERVFKKTGVILTGVTPYAATEIGDDDEAAAVRADVGRIVWGHDHVVELRGLYIDPATSTVRFDAIKEYGPDDRDELCDSIMRECKELHPDWTFDVRVLPDAGD